MDDKEYQYGIGPVDIWYVCQREKIDRRKKKRKGNSKQFEGGRTDHKINVIKAMKNTQ